VNHNDCSQKMLFGSSYTSGFASSGDHGNFSRPSKIENAKKSEQE